MDSNSPVGERPIGGDTELELELTEAYRRIIFNESRLGLMEKLLNHGLCTRDVYAFACKQADLCETLHVPDESTIKSAMRTKIRDLTQTLKIDHRKRRKTEMKLLNELGGRSWKLKKKIKHIKNILQHEKLKQEMKYDKKIDHYKKTMNRIINDRNAILGFINSQ